LSTTDLQGSVATWVNDGGIFNDFFIANLLLSTRILKIGQDSAKLWRKIKWHFFPDTV